MVQRLRLAFWAFIVILVVAVVSMPGSASSHREAPLISQDPLADNTDVYAFVSPASPDKVTLIANFIPLEAAGGGPNFFKFDDNVLYEIMVDNDGDAVEDVTFQFRFRTETRNPNTFLYNTGPITSLDDPDWNVRQFYSVTRIDGPRRTGRRTVLADDLPTPPVNVGFRSTAELRHALPPPRCDRSTTASGLCRPARRSVLRRSQRVRSARVPPADINTPTRSPVSTSTRSRSKCRSRR